MERTISDLVSVSELTRAVCRIGGKIRQRGKELTNMYGIRKSAQPIRVLLAWCSGIMLALGGVLPKMQEGESFFETRPWQTSG